MPDSVSEGLHSTGALCKAERLSHAVRVLSVIRRRTFLTMVVDVVRASRCSVAMLEQLAWSAIRHAAMLAWISPPQLGSTAASPGIIICLHLAVCV